VRRQLLQLAALRRTDRTQGVGNAKKEKKAKRIEVKSNEKGANQASRCSEQERRRSSARGGRFIMSERGLNRIGGRKDLSLSRKQSR